jgi:GAF domain-containing protein
MGDEYADNRGLSSWPAEMRDAALSSQCVQVRSANQARLYAPIQVRQQVIGVINLLKRAPQPEASAGSEAATAFVEWSPEEIEMIEGLCEQLGVALESARLYQSSRRLAAREQLTAQVTSRIRETLDINTVLESAVQEIQKALRVPEVVISLHGGAASEPDGEVTDEGDGRPQIEAG